MCLSLVEFYGVHKVLLGEGYIVLWCVAFPIVGPSMRLEWSQFTLFHLYGISQYTPL